VESPSLPILFWGDVRGQRVTGCDVVLVARNRKGSFVAALLRMTAEGQMQIPHFVRDDTRVGRDGVRGIVVRPSLVRFAEIVTFS
jgi:hypothetical protein